MQDLVRQDNISFLSELPHEVASLYSALSNLDDESLEESTSNDLATSLASEPMVQVSVGPEI